MIKKNKQFYSLIPLEDFKALMGIDSREDKTASFCLTTATLNIERYCMRTFLRKKKTEILELTGDFEVPLGEYPVSEIHGVYGINSQGEKYIESYLYKPMFGCALNEDKPFSILFSSSLKQFRFSAVKVIYKAGYKAGILPSDLSAACAELAIWNMNRYRGRRVGMTGNIKGAGIQGEHFELFMPENVRKLLEPYRRKTI